MPLQAPFASDAVSEQVRFCEGVVKAFRTEQFFAVKNV